MLIISDKTALSLAKSAQRDDPTKQTIYFFGDGSQLHVTDAGAVTPNPAVVGGAPSNAELAGELLAIAKQSRKSFWAGLGLGGVGIGLVSWWRHRR